MAGPRRRRRDPKLQRFLLDGERVVVDVRQHWFVIAGPVAFTLIALFVVMWVDARVRVDAGEIARVLWFAWFIMLGWMGFQIAQWRHDRFIATDKRLLMDYGLITQKIAMMPFIKVTDMGDRRGPPAPPGRARGRCVAARIGVTAAGGRDPHVSLAERSAGQRINAQHLRRFRRPPANHRGNGALRQPPPGGPGAPGR